MHMHAVSAGGCPSSSDDPERGRKGLEVTGALFHESLADALRDCIAICGGLKAVGVKLWPEKDADHAGRTLADCLNDGKRDKLSPEQVLLILRMARAHGCHAGMAFICRDLGYSDPQPIEPEDERAALQRQFVESTALLLKLASRIEELARPVVHPRRAA